MKDFIFITGNQKKADYLALWLDHPVEHRKIDLEEIQSLDLREVVEHKVKSAYKIVGQPVLVEDVALTFTAMGRLPGTYIKWFLEEMGSEGIARMAASLEHPQAIASIMYALYDGKDLHIFDAEVLGTIASTPRGENTFGKGWNGIFIPDGSNKTYGEMTDEEMKPFNHRAKAIAKLQGFLRTQA